ncbi:MAG TPA: bacillithiol biosynthesis cysteine-adding enzyme BshC [Pyrinomonadaceae bacterium]|jgi:bacillithiol biosynthesis cysteine-adding enzyme BshC|nr:bacillithiol biosynthesis cysteine-adding enzyme BshC [Pyrinomonadaceae bacterium]
MKEIQCPSVYGNITLRADSLPFEVIPGQSKLFIEYQNSPLSLTEFYPEAVASHTNLSGRIKNVLDNYKTDRAKLCNALEEMNKKLGAGEPTLKNIELLRQNDTVAVVTGQQAGLFTGPLYTIYKALSAVRLVECLRARGINAVPIFWVATEDHDFEEVSHTFFLDKEGQLFRSQAHIKLETNLLPVGFVQLDETIKTTIDETFSRLRNTEFTNEYREIIEQNWRPGEYFGDAFAKTLVKLLGCYGLIVLCPLNRTLKELAAPIYVDAIRKAPEIVEALKHRSRKLEENGYNAQVHITDDYFPLFWQSRDKLRHSLKKISDNKFRTKDGLREFTLEELAAIAEKEPFRFSPSVVLRSVVQDYLLPTLCYFGGAAEIAYFAQSSEVYRILERPVTPILHRQSFTFVESKHAKTLKRFELGFTDLFSGMENLVPMLVEKFSDPASARLFAEVEERINEQLRRLDELFSQTDITLAENLAKRRRKIIYHIAALRARYQKSQLRRDVAMRNQIEGAFAALWPNKALQERTLNIGYFINRFGLQFVDWIKRAIELEDKGHRIVYL